MPYLGAVFVFLAGLLGLTDPSERPWETVRRCLRGSHIRAWASSKHVPSIDLQQVTRHTPEKLALHDILRPPDTETLAEAVATYRQMLTTYSREQMPLPWAMTQNNLGNTLVTLGTRKSDSTLMCEALASYTSSWEAVVENAAEYAAHVVHNAAMALQVLQRDGTQPTSQACLSQYHNVLERMKLLAPKP